MQQKSCEKTRLPLYNSINQLIVKNVFSRNEDFFANWKGFQITFLALGQSIFSFAQKINLKSQNMLFKWWRLKGVQMF